MVTVAPMPLRLLLVPTSLTVSQLFPELLFLYSLTRPRATLIMKMSA